VLKPSPLGTSSAAAESHLRWCHTERKIELPVNFCYGSSDHGSRPEAAADKHL